MKGLPQYVFIALALIIAVEVANMTRVFHFDARTAPRADSLPAVTPANDTPPVQSASPAPEKPACVLTTDKKIYEPGTPMHFTWSSTDATGVSFVENLSPLINQGIISLPESANIPINITTETKAPNGSVIINASWGNGYETAVMRAHGLGGDSYCLAQYYVGKDDTSAGTVVQTFSDLPTTLSFSINSDKAVSADGTLSITSRASSFVVDRDGTVTSGGVVFLVRDGAELFPVYVGLSTPAKVYLHRGKFVFSVSYIKETVKLSITKL